MNVKKRLGELLLDAGVIDEAQLQTALTHQRKWGGKLGQALVELKLASEPQIVAALSRKLGYEIVDVAALQWSPALEGALKLVPAEVSLRQTLLPVTSDAASVTVAMSAPSNIAVVDELAFRTGRRIKIALAGDRAIAAAVQRFYFGDEDRRRFGIAQRSVPLEDPPARGRSAGASRVPRTPEATPGQGFRGGTTEPLTLEPLAVEPTPRSLTPREAAMLDALQRAARGADTALVTSGQLAGVLMRVRLRKGLVSEADLVEELAKP